MIGYLLTPINTCRRVFVSCSPRCCVLAQTLFLRHRIVSHHSFNLCPPAGGWVCRAPKLRGLRILEIVMENKGGVTIPRWAFGLAAAVVALLVVLVIVLIPRGGDNSNTSASGGSNGAAQSKATSTVAAGTCGAALAPQTTSRYWTQHPRTPRG